MTAEELIEANSLPAIEHYHTVPVVPESIAIKALEMKEREHQDKLREIREEIFNVYNAESEHDSKWALGVKYTLQILDKYLDDKK